MLTLQSVYVRKKMHLPFNNNIKTNLGMTLKDIAIFKHFIAEKDLRKPFIRVYRASKSFAKLPDSIENYFSNVDPLAAIIAAARVCQPNSTYGYDFWQNLHQEWKQYYAKYSGLELSEEKLPTLSGYFHILRENWNDKDKPWRYEQLEDAQGRLGLPIAEKVEVKPEEEPIIEQNKEDDDELEFFDITPNTKQARYKLMMDEISVTARKQGYRITFNQFVTKEIKDFGSCYACLAKTKTGDIVLQLNKTGGVNVNLGYRDDRTGNTNICAKDLCIKLKTLMNVSTDYFILNIKKVKHTEQVINFILKK